MADLPVYLHLMRAQVRAQAQYRLSFLVDVTCATLFTTLDLLALLVLFRVTRALGGFNLREAFLITALASFSFALSDLSAGNVERLGQYVRTGLLDALLVRPRAVLPQLLFTDFTLRRVGQVAQGAVALALACQLNHVRYTPAHLALLVLAPICGALFFISLFVAGATVAFYWIDSGELANSFTYGGRTFAQYPITVYSGLFRRVFAYGLGFAFVAYYPGLLLLDRPDPLGGPAWLGWTGPAVAALAATLATLAWRTGIRHYRSTGS
ncbi:MAG TPA: ABC-2 family transporter protein [Rugosimonospora sp.]|nr:ABC-2 family transporter protein [Rugosimonospora sp.]